LTRQTSQSMTWEIKKEPTCGTGADGARLTYVVNPNYYEISCNDKVIDHLKAPGTPKTIEVEFFAKGKAYNLCRVHQLEAVRKDPKNGFTCNFGGDFPQSTGTTCPADISACKPDPWD